MRQHIKSDIKTLTVLSVFAALMVVSQVVMASLPNIELVTTLIILASVLYGWKALYPVAAFVLVEGLLYGFGLYWFSYIYIWALLVCIVVPLRKHSHFALWTVVAGLYGLCFGTLTSIPWFFISGFKGVISYIVAGLSFDIIHAVGNAALTLILFEILFRISLKCGIGDGKVK